VEQIAYCRICNSKHVFSNYLQMSKCDSCSDCGASGKILASRPYDFGAARLIATNENSLFQKHSSRCCLAPVHLSKPYGLLGMREAICSFCLEPFLAKTRSSVSDPERVALAKWKQLSSCCGSKPKVVGEKGRYNRICEMCKEPFVLLNPNDEPTNQAGVEKVAKKAKESDRNNSTIGCLLIIAVLAGIIWFVVWFFGLLFQSDEEKLQDCLASSSAQALRGSITNAEYEEKYDRCIRMYGN
jgi:hypothetical protein